MKILQNSRAVIMASILLLTAGAANADSPVNATESVATQEARINDERGHRHRHGPPGKGWFHDGRHSLPDAADESKQLNRYGPPSTRLHRAATNWKSVR